jgi:chromosomal replication initiation ATPase DnaA
VESDWKFFYFVPMLDSDQDGYNKEYDEYIKYKLTPHMQPIIIYINDTFVKPAFENKYKQLVEDNIKEYNKTWNDITKIMKVEERY